MWRGSELWKTLMMKLIRILVLVGLIGFCGCGERTETELQEQLQKLDQSFAEAPAEAKDGYQTLISAIEGNDFPGAKAVLDRLNRANLTQEQQAALTERRNELMVKLALAAQKGDAGAGKMLLDLRAQPTSR